MGWDDVQFKWSTPPVRQSSSVNKPKKIKRTTDELIVMLWETGNFTVEKIAKMYKKPIPYVIDVLQTHKELKM